MPGQALQFTGVSGYFKLQAAVDMSATATLRSSADGFTRDLASQTVLGTGSTNTFSVLSNQWTEAALSGVFNPVEFRLYFTDTSDSSSDILRLDDLVFLGYATNLPPGVQLVTISAADAAARESGSDSGLFRFQRFGETTGFVREGQLRQ